MRLGNCIKLNKNNLNSSYFIKKERNMYMWVRILRKKREGNRESNSLCTEIIEKRGEENPYLFH